MSRLALVLLVLVVAGCEEEYAVPNPSLEVLVTAEGRPVEGMRVTLKPWDPAHIVEQSAALTPASGVVSFANLHSGTYTLEFEHDVAEVACASATVEVLVSYYYDEDVKHHQECEPIRMGMVIFLGLLDFEPDTVRMSVGERLVLVHQPPLPGTTPPEPGPGKVLVSYQSIYPKAVPCTDVSRDVLLPVFTAQLPYPCPMVVADHKSSRPDTAIIVGESTLEEMTAKVYRILPCMNPANWQGGGMFRECATASYTRHVRGPGLERNGEGWVVATECGRTWYEVVRLDGWKERWPPEPFDGYARLEVVVRC